MKFHVINVIQKNRRLLTGTKCCSDSRQLTSRFFEPQQVCRFMCSHWQKSSCRFSPGCCYKPTRLPFPEASQTGKSPVASPSAACWWRRGQPAFGSSVVPAKSLCRLRKLWTNSQFHISDKLQGKYWSTLTRGRGWSRGIWGGRQKNKPLLMRQEGPANDISPKVTVSRTQRLCSWKHSATDYRLKTEHTCWQNMCWLVSLRFFFLHCKCPRSIG